MHEHSQIGLIIAVGCVALFAMVAQRLATTIITAPVIFLSLGFALAEGDLIPTATADSLLHVVAEIALILLLFIDAARTDSEALRTRHTWPIRMLLLGLPLAILLGAVAALPFLQDWPLLALLLLAAILAPTDAALGSAVVSNPKVPDRQRATLTVESGLNDGLALPLVLLFASTIAETESDGSLGTWLLFALKQILLGPLVGALCGAFGGKLLRVAQARNWTAESFEGVGVVALASLAYLLAVEVGGNGFIAAFAAGLAFGRVVEGHCQFVFEFTDNEGQLLTWSAFLLIGAALVPQAIQHLDWDVLGLILLSLFVVRPVAIWIALARTDASPLTRLFFGWFGPRGLATALFALLVIPTVDGEFAEPILYIAINTVWISALLHGVTAAPGASYYAARHREKGAY